ncbi:MAG: helix-turn-helix domain-containing protein [Stellaceae bacterium]
MAEFCRRCRAEIVTAKLMDIDPGVDRAHFALVLPGDRRRQLSATEWRLFAALYRRHGRVIPDVELTRAARIPAYALREHIRRLRNLLFGSRFRLVRHRSYGYELVVQLDDL